MTRKLTDKERAELNRLWPEMMLSRTKLKMDRVDIGTQIKEIERRMDHIGAVLRLGEIEQDDQAIIEWAS